MHIGQKVKWHPSAFIRARDSGAPESIITELTGEIAYINAEHRYYMIEAQCHGYTIRECFKY